jgi:alkylation response protein AidB-like acyl-CoA dehydrogenase
VARENGRNTDPLIRQDLVRYYSKWQILRINGLRGLTAAVSGRKDPDVMKLGVGNKAFWSEMHRDAMELALDIHGADSLLVSTGPENWPGVMRQRGRSTYPVTPMMSAFFFSRSETIWGGTAEIQRNIIGERALGLPKEPKAAGA